MFDFLVLNTQSEIIYYYFLTVIIKKLKCLNISCISLLEQKLGVIKFG